MKEKNRYRKLLTRMPAVWIYLPGLAMIALGISILVFPDLLPWVLAGFFILLGLLCIQSIRVLRRLGRRIRAQVTIAAAEALEKPHPPAFPQTPYTSWIN